MKSSARFRNRVKPGVWLKLYGPSCSTEGIYKEPVYENANRGVVRVVCLRHEPLGGRGVDIKKAWVLTFIDQVDLRRGS
eukprot:COSAG02_NODE_40503_length_404_cov_9.786885_1_plen_78_part_10